MRKCPSANHQEMSIKTLVDHCMFIWINTLKIIVACTDNNVEKKRNSDMIMLKIN